MALPDRAANVLPTLIEELELAEGPIAFVAHSLGGLVVEETLRLAESKSAHDRAVSEFVRRVRKIAFIGTPHLGADMGTITNAFSFFLRPRETTRGLSRNDPHLRALNSWFRGFAQKNDIEALVLQESQPMPVLGSRWLGSMIVKPDSADPGLPPATYVVPLDEDHDSIRSPRDREAEVYKRLHGFISRPIGSLHPDTDVVDKIQSLATDIRHQTEAFGALKAEIKEVSSNSVEAFSGSENAVISSEASRRLWQMRQSRYITDFDTKLECERLFRETLRGELSSASKNIRRMIYAWCARATAPFDLTLAKEMFAEAQKLGGGDENEIAKAFLLVFEKNDKPTAWAILSKLDTSTARSASFLIAAHNETSEKALQWLEDAGLSSSALDPDGKMFVILRRMEVGDWSGALADVEGLLSEDFEVTPLLWNCAASIYLSQAVHEDLRAQAISYLPTDLKNFLLGDDATSMAYREKARQFFEHAANAFEKLGSRKGANTAADYALWLSLRNPATARAALQVLEKSMSDPKHQLRRIPMALDFRLKLDLNQVEKEIDKETTASGGKSSEAAIARFALAMTESDPGVVAKYVARHRSQLLENYDSQYISSIEIEALARSGQVAEARSALSILERDGAHQGAVTALNHIIDEAAGADPILTREAQYIASPNLPSLLVLVDFLKSVRAHAKLVKYGKTLFEATKDLPHAEVYADALYQEGLDDDIVSLANSYPEFFENSDNLATILSWAYFRKGCLQEANALLDRLRTSRDAANDRYLTMNIAIVSGDWSSLGAFVESEWAHRTERSPVELLRAGQLAQRIGSEIRSQELVREAAKIADGNAEILLGCYSAATAAGWENDAAVHQWFVLAAESSGDSGLVKKVGLRELLDMQPGWNDRQQRAWDMLLEGSTPMFAAAASLHRTLLDQYLVPALQNLNEADPRKRSIVFASSGARPLMEVSSKQFGLDVTAILTLALVGLLQKVIDEYDSISIAHTTFGWLFEERAKLEFHQPSRVQDALEIKRLVDSGRLHKFDGPEGTLEVQHEVGDELARLLAAAATIAEGETSAKFVIRPYPVPKPDTFMDEVADTTGFENYLAGCGDVVAALRKAGQITSHEEQLALKYLSIHEKPWPHNPVLQPNSILFLDGLAVTYLQHLELLEKLKPAGFNAYLPKSELDESDALINFEASRNQAKALIEGVRSALANGLSSGKIKLGTLPTSDDDAEDGDIFSLRHHPSVALFEAAPNVDAFVIDDRFYNQHGSIDTPAGRRAIFTSLELIATLEKNNVITEADLIEAYTTLRHAGLILVPNRESEFPNLIVAAPVTNGMVAETAELRAIRESILRIRMTKCLRITKEHTWLDNLTRTLLSAIRAQWNEGIADIDARARSSWLFELLDTRCWTHQAADAPSSPIDRFQALLQALTLLPGATPIVQERYWNWLEDTVLTQFRDESPFEYRALLEEIEKMVAAGPKRVPSLGGERV